MLKIAGGQVPTCAPGGRKHPYQDCIQIDTSHEFLFICGGVSWGLDDVSGGGGWACNFDRTSWPNERPAPHTEPEGTSKAACAAPTWTEDWLLRPDQSFIAACGQRGA